ncbi:DNA gyrase inhibitor YacG [Rhodovarius crocodyli]|uniref:DNA gyrase inhibitor YacG n=1 Tax=Rhodovarius crocodyli TaxID=1979269 RepID=A0A437MCA9_9PROT|nr:DNA gyrase inhibitor YacG [Rhodovarius crocodyli]RVT95284.1 DNA gyrase inhibitor YacG [Rhodovarius crocodyli]
MTDAKPCPICQKPAVLAFKPFCSARCRQVDLGKWLTESYSVPAQPPGEEDDGA